MPSDAVIIAIATGVLALIGIMVNGSVVYFVAKLNTQAQEAAKAVGEVKVKAEEAAAIVKEVKTKLATSNTVVDTKLDEISHTGKAVHILVNSNSLAQLRLTALALRQSAVTLHRIADMTKQRGDITAAVAADKVADEADLLYHDHENKQKVVDAEVQARIA